MKSNIIDLEPRIVVKPDLMLGIIKYDHDNNYPQRIRLYQQGSSTTTGCVNLYAKYMRGQSFLNSTFFSSHVNRKKQTWDRILRFVTDEYALFNSFALHFNFNALGQISEINTVPFEHIRLCEPDDTGYIGKVKLYNNWDKRSGKPFDAKKIITVDVFNPSPDVVLQQMEKAGGIELYKGQIYYHAENEYPKAKIDSIIEDCETDGELKYFKNRNVTTGFLANHIWIDKAQFESAADELKHLNNIKKFQGARNSSKILRVAVKAGEEIPEIKPLQSTIDDKLFAYTETSVRDKIISAFQQPPILLGVVTQGALGEKNDREGAKNVYSETTQDERILFEAFFSYVFDYWHAPEHNPTKDFTITPIAGVSKDINIELYKDMTPNERRTRLLNLQPVTEKASASKLLVETLGVGGTQALTEILVNNLLSFDQKKAALKLVFGFSDEDATTLATNNSPKPAEEKPAQ
jgi:hypothetical protein